MTDPIEDLEQQVGKRHLIIEWDTGSDELSLEGDFAPWMLAGIGAWLTHLAEVELDQDDDGA